jgi:hypothetical protein
MKELQKSLLVTLITTVVALLCAEGAFRYLSGKRVFALTRYRAANIVINEFPKNVMSYDPLLGWRMNPGVAYPTPEERKLPIKIPEFHTMDYGVRRNSVANDHPQQGGVLVSGASFTIGSEVNDEDAWPAQLETLIGQPVVNGAVGGFGADQIVLRAEEMLPVIKPKVVIVDLVQDNIATAGYSYAGYPKPYFTVENGRLALQNVPVPQHQPRKDIFAPLKNVLSYSLMIDRIMATYFPDAWYSSRTQNCTRANNDEVNVSCLLLQRLKKETDEAGIRLLITMQYGGGTITNTSAADGNVMLLDDCIGRMGIQHLDEFTTLKELSRKSPEEFRSLYVINNGILGHKSRAGNLKVAKSVAEALAASVPAVNVSHPVQSQEPVEASDATQPILVVDNVGTLFQSSEIAKIVPQRTFFGVHTYRLVAVGRSGEHYLAAAVPDSVGTLSFSVEASAATTSRLKLQLLRTGADKAVCGVIGDFDLRRLSAGHSRIGLATNIGSGIKPIGDGWYRTWVTAKLPPGDGQTTIVIQVGSSQDEFSYRADGDSVDIRNVIVEQNGPLAEHQVNATGSNVQ